VCFLENSLEYVPTTYTYADPSGRPFTMGATGELRSIKDRQGNPLTFTPGGITSNTGVTVPLERDTAGGITKITSSPLDAGSGPDITTYEPARRRPRVVVLDNLREGVITTDIYDSALNPLYRDVLAHYGAVALPCRVRDPDRKGKVESGVGHAQRTPLAGMRFENIEAAQAYLDR
jgi:hypothetical protein